MSKLVRDGIPDLMRAQGQQPNTRNLGEDEYIVELWAKLQEEVDELANATVDGVAEEIADVVEVLRAIANERGIEWTTVEEVRSAKKATRGGFSKRIYLC